jgi:hypothetical protein
MSQLESTDAVSGPLAQIVGIEGHPHTFADRPYPVES